MKKWFAAVALVAAAAVPFVLVYRVRVAEAAWARSFGPIDEIPAKYKRPDNGKAAMVSDWARRAGADPGRVQTAVFDYLAAQTTSASDPLQPNSYVQHYHAAELDDFANWVGDDPPVFSRVLRSPAERVPHALPVFRLERALIAAAFARAAANDTAGAERLLDASWKINDALRRGPTWLEQLVAIAAFRYQLGALRKIDVDPAKWLPRIHSYDALASLAFTGQIEAWYKDRAVRENLYASTNYLRDMREMHQTLVDAVPFKPRWLQVLRTPVRWFDLPSILEGDRAMITAAATVPRSEHVDASLEQAWERGASRWSYIADSDLDNINWSSAFRRAVRADTERELTEKVLMARAAHRANGSWPASIDGIATSSLANAHWIYERTATGASIRLSHDINWGNLLGPVVPLRYALR